MIYETAKKATSTIHKNTNYGAWKIYLVGSTVIARSLKSGGGSGRSRPLEQSPSRT